MATNKQERRARVKKGIRKKVSGTAQRPRLTVFRSSRHIYAQLIDDLAGKTMASASSHTDGVAGASPIAVGKAVGLKLAENAKTEGIDAAIFDRNGYRYHGRVKALAEGAREGGLQF